MLLTAGKDVEVKHPKAAREGEGLMCWVPTLGFSTKEFLIPGARKHTHVPSQVTSGASLFRSGTYRTWKDKVHGIGFPEKSAQDQKK